MYPPMKLFLLGIAAMIALPSSWCFQPLPPSSNVQTTFSTKLFLEVLKTQKMKNTVMSTASVQIALSILYVGAAGDTRLKMSKALGIKDSDYDKYIDGIAFIIKLAEHSPSLKIASTVFFNKKLRLLEEYEVAIKDSFASDVQQLDFNDGPKSAKSVNDWCSKKTNGLIKELVSEDDFQKNGLAVIVNAIYFKARWVEQFSEFYTKIEDFSTIDKSGSISKVKVKMMRMDNTEFLFNDNHEELNAQIIQLDYLRDRRGESFNMVIILPKEVDGIRNTLNKLKTINLQSVLESLDSGLITVRLPKFKQEVKLDLKRDMKKVGLSNIFSRGANFRKLSNKDSCLSKVVQKAVISVAENGTEAAVATAFVGIMPLSSKIREPLRKYTFTADHPFIYFIMMQGVPLPIFQGIVMKPEFEN